MVGYQKFVSLVFEVARERGRSIDSLDASQDVLVIAADLWREGKPELKDASPREARNWIQENA